MHVRSRLAGFLGGLALLATVSPTCAIERYHAAAMTCPALQTALAAQGKAVVLTPSSQEPGMMLYDVYVARREMCTGLTWPRVKHLTTADGKRCTIYRCGQVTRSSPRY